jgi:hypothetical protein
MVDIKLEDLGMQERPDLHHDPTVPQTPRAQAGTGLQRLLVLGRAHDRRRAP